jgi:hypothetical protein
VWERTTPELPTSEIASSYWPTPRSSENENRTTHNAPSRGNGHGKTLAEANGTTHAESLHHQAAKWATPGARDWKDTSGMATSGTNPDGSERDRLDQLARQAFEFAKKWPTPTAGDAKAAGSRNAENTKAHLGVSLTDMALTGDSFGRRGPPDLTTSKGGPSTSSDGRVLNPLFVEALQGWPIGWSDCGSWGMESCPIRPRSRSSSSGAACSGARS